MHLIRTGTGGLHPRLAQLLCSMNQAWRAAAAVTASNYLCNVAAAATPLSRAKKRPRVADAPELFADLVSNMTSQGGGDDTDSEADDSQDEAYQVGQAAVWWYL